MRGGAPRARALSPSTVLAALQQRLLVAAQLLLDDAPPADATPEQTITRLLPRLIEVCAERGRADARWLLLTAVFGAYPSWDQMMSFTRELELTGRTQVESSLLARVIAQPRRGRLDLPMTVLTSGALVDVDFCARYDAHTGIQRVVRETLPRWDAAHEVHPAAWIDEQTALRTLSPEERRRVFSHGDGPDADRDEAGPRLLVPWKSVLVLPDVPNHKGSSQLAALARFSGSEVTMIGYDMIPITSADTRPSVDSVTFAQHLTVAKHARRVAGISRSATAEYSGFAQAVRAQGLTGPTVREIRLADERPRGVLPGRRPEHRRPVMLCTGTREPHKNQRAALHAAERLWSEGVDLEVRLVGGPGWSDDVLGAAIRRLRAANRPLVDLGRVSDNTLFAELESADFVVFASLHEGFGLPVAEALACGTPVVTSNFGSQLEIAEGGGCLVVDPRDDDDLTAAIRRLATVPEELDRLRAESQARPLRSWDEYVTDLWAFLVEGRDPT